MLGIEDFHKITLHHSLLFSFLLSLSLVSKEQGMVCDAVCVCVYLCLYDERDKVGLVRDNDIVNHKV